ncbi:DUF6082 family protein [Plantactinospora sp. CA-290183]|uniref:DUF6082 family protein n=1 Tax=Plantactinospora sp. CA-290183 TaxID=3240006 RepID=UPI003D8AACD1
MTADPFSRPVDRGTRNAGLRLAQKIGMSAAVVTTTVIGMALLLGSPVVLLSLYADLSDARLGRMSDLGQAYGALSALLSGAATIGIAAALLLQVRQVKISQAQGMRTMQIELMRMLIERPELRPVSPSGQYKSMDQRRRDIFSNLILKYLELGYEIGYFPADSLRGELRDQMKVRDIREHWQRIRIAYEGGLQNRSQRRFIRLVDEACRRASEEARYDSSADRVIKPEMGSCGFRKRRLPATSLGVLVGVALVAGAAVRWRRARRVRPDGPP